MIKTILVPAIGDPADATTFAAALAVARLFTAHIDALHVRLDPLDVAVAMTTDAGAGALAAGLIEDLERDANARETAAQRIFAEFCARERLAVATAPAAARAAPSAQWHVETGQEPRWMASYGLAADLVVASRGGMEDAGARAILEAVLLETGRPLLIPSGTALPTAERVAIAWKPTAQAARAVGAAMPFLTRAKAVHVMTVEEETERRTDPDRLLRNLAWHGVAATAERLMPGPAGAAATLLAAAKDKAGLLVMGGYGHSRLREWVFGGFTQQVLAEAPIAVLLTH